MSEYKEDFKRFSSEAAASRLARSYSFRIKVEWADISRDEMCKISKSTWGRLIDADPCLKIKVSFHINQPFTVCTIR